MCPQYRFCPALPFVFWCWDSNLDDFHITCTPSPETLITLCIIPLIAIQDPIFFFRWNSSCLGRSGQLVFSKIIQDGARGQEQQANSPRRHYNTCNPCWHEAQYIEGSRHVTIDEGGSIRHYTKDSSYRFPYVNTSKCTLLGTPGCQPQWVVTPQSGPVLSSYSTHSPSVSSWPAMESCLLGVFCPQVLFRNLTGPIKAQCWWRQPVLPSPTSPALSPLTQWGRL